MMTHAIGGKQDAFGTKTSFFKSVEDRLAILWKIMNNGERKKG